MKKTFLFFIFLVVVNNIYTQKQYKTKAYPTLWVNGTQLAEMRKNIKDSTLKLVGWLNLKKLADRYLKEKLEVPDRGANWEQYYISPITSNPLSRGALIGNWKWKHFDSRTGTQFLSDSSDIEKDYDGVVLGWVHNTWALGAVELGLAYQITKDTAYLERGKQILLKYALLYPKLAERTRSNGRLSAQGSGKIHVQDLNESQWLVNIAEAADLVWGSLSEQDRKTIENKLLLPAAEVVMKRRPDITNIQCWRNTAIGCVGFLLGNERLIRWAMEDSTGFQAQIKEGFNSDGITKDLSPGYQFFTLHPLVLLAQSAINSGYPVDITPMQKMFKTPILMSNSKLMLPAFNDSKPIMLGDQAYLYEWASTKFDDPSFNEVLINSGTFTSFEIGYHFTGWNLLFGSRYLKKPSLHSSESRKFDSSGVAVLSKGKGDANLSSYVKFTNQTKNLRHFHKAQLDMAIIKGNEHIAVIPGNVNYASPFSDGWYRSGVAHNTLIFNEKEQRRSSGKCLAFGSTKGIDYVITSTANLYIHSAAFVRTLAMLDENTVVVIDQFRAAKPEPAMFDLFYHQAGSFENRRPGEPWKAPDSIGYRYLDNTLVNRQQKDFYVETKLESGRIVTTSGICSVEGDIITGYGQPFLGKSVPFNMYRVKTKSTETVTVAYCISTQGKKMKLKMINIENNNNPESFVSKLLLTNEKGTHITIIINPYNETLPEAANNNNTAFDVHLENVGN